ncbi:MAG: hypothetical protein A2W05_10440 [Candidatus Schekmanbacteria bacterium RBG_16_38_10]|uniref:Uncharacterized protein n=1 Tax=Candidatus Schekmanbacteria bacterium RBG_16_38_10 TaxID=1817879 RepID=A0A1F7S0U6_9BACT|nr:MAG: hypothetical protein A2W05_10440 [Candidatus Schekmanbacteria bacterium RBG_16_38_10]
MKRVFVGLIFAIALPNLLLYPQEKKIGKFNKREVKIYYTVEDISGVKDKELYVTTDDGRSWNPANKVGAVDWGGNGSAYAIFHATSDGTYGFTFRFSDTISNTPTPPTAGEMPDLIAVIDTTPPTITVKKDAEQKLGVSNIKIYYEATDINGVDEARLWVTQDGGKTWKLATGTESGSDRDSKFIIYKASEDGIYGFIPQAIDTVGNKTPSDPLSNDKPSLEVTVDTKASYKPIVIEPKGKEEWIAGNIYQIKWLSQELYIKPKSISLYYSYDGKIWTLITKGLDATGFYWWTPPAKATDELRIKATATNAKGEEIESSPTNNISVNVVSKPDIATAKMHFQRGTLIRAQGKLEESAIEFNKAITLWQDYTDALNDLGFVYYNKQEYGRALEYFLRAKRVDVNNPSAYVNTALALLNLGLIDDALSEFKDAVELGLDTRNTELKTLAIESADALWHIAQTYSSDKQYDKAVDTCRTILKIYWVDKSTRKKAEEFISAGLKPQQ